MLCRCKNRDCKWEPYPPFYQLGGRGPFYVTLWTGEHDPSKDSDYFDQLGHVSYEIARTTSKDAALAVLRLHGAKEFFDWTVNGAHWGMSATAIS